MQQVPCLRILRTEEGNLLSVAWAPDGRRLAVGDMLGGVTIWSADGRMLWRRVEHTRWVNGVSWSPDGRRLASASSGGTIRIWDADIGHSLWRYKEPSGVFAAVWSPDGKRLAWGSSAEVRIVEAETDSVSLICAGHRGYVYGIAWSGDGSRLAASLGNHKICIWDARGGALLGFLEGHQDAVRSVSWAPDSQRLASASTDKTLRIWDVSHGHCQLRCDGHSERVATLHWSPLGDLLASGSDDKTVRLWSPYTGQLLACLADHASLVRSVAFSPDGDRLASASSDGAVRLWDVSAVLTAQPGAQAHSIAAYLARQAHTVGRRPLAASRAAWVPRLANAEGRCLGILRDAAAPASAALPGPPSAALHPSARLLVSSSSNGTVRCWDLLTGLPRWENTERHVLGVSDVALSPDGQRLASASNDLTIYIWDSRNGQCLVRCQEDHGGAALKVCWSPDGQRLASASDYAVRIWNPATGERLVRCSGHHSAVSWVDWSPNGRWLASGAADRTVRIWDAHSGECLRELQGPDNWSISVCWSPDGRYLATAGDGHSINIRTVQNWRSVHCWPAHEDANYIYCLAWSPDGRWLASGANDHTIRIWDAVSGHEMIEYGFFEAYAWRLAWSADGSFLASSHPGDYFRLWDARELRRSQAANTSPARAGVLPPDLAPLPPALAALQRLQLYPPLSLLRDLLHLTGGRLLPDALAALAAHSGLQRLAALRWPLPARVGLVALLLQKIPLTGWQPPAGLVPGELQAALTTALTGQSSAPQPPAPPLAGLQQNVARIDERLVDLLMIIGPEAVALDPGLPLRLSRQPPLVPPLSAAQRRLLALRLPAVAEPGRVQRIGRGGERAGIVRHGELQALLPSQLMLPALLLHSRHVRGELLYRAHTAQESPRWRPVVLVLDVTPPCYGPVEVLTRLAAHMIVQSVRQAQLPVMLITTGSSSRVHLLESPTDGLAVWTQRSDAPADAAGALRLARSLRESLRDGPLEPIVVVLTQPWFGAEDDLPVTPALRGLFIQYPERAITPALAVRCERWESLTVDEIERLPACLGRLLS